MPKLPITPLRRAGSDFVSADGSTLAEDKIRQLCMTEPGEIPWRPGFGVGLEGLLHRGNDATTAELARIRARAGVDKWLGGDVNVSEISPSREDETLRLTFRYDVAGGEADALVELSEPDGVS